MSHVCHVRTQHEGTICNPGRELSPEPSYAGTLISDFQSSALGEKFLLVKLFSLWYFVMAT